jgi:hypothetical protein
VLEDLVAEGEGTGHNMVGRSNGERRRRQQIMRGLPKNMGSTLWKKQAQLPASQWVHRHVRGPWFFAWDGRNNAVETTFLQ